MSQLFFKAISFKSAVATHQLRDVQALVDYEAGALAHWIFDKSSPLVLMDMDGLNSLSLQAGATINPTFDTQGVELSSNVGNALMSAIYDEASEDITLAFVGKSSVVAGAMVMLFGNLPTTGYGPAIWIQTNAVYGALKGSSNQMLTASLNINPNEYFFAALSINKSSKKLELYLRNSSGSNSNSLTYTTMVPSKSSYPVALGSSHYTNVSTAGKIKSAESMIFKRALSLTEMQALANRTAMRCAKRGVIF